MKPALLLFLTVTLPIMITILIGMWINNRQLDKLRAAINRGFDRLMETSKRFS